jgi:hypothetical protein
MAQVVGCLSSKHEVLSSKPRTAKKKKSIAIFYNVGRTEYNFSK